MEHETAKQIDARLAEAQELLGQAIQLAYESGADQISSRISRHERDVHKLRLNFRKEHKLA